MRFFTTLLLALQVLFLAAVGTTRAIGTQQATPSPVRLVLPDPACPAPCWNGINTDQTSHRITVERIMSLPHAQQKGILNWQFRVGGIEIGIRLERGRDFILTPTHGVRLGDIIAALGPPDTQLKGIAVDRIRALNGSYVSFLYKKEHVIFSIVHPHDERISPVSMIDRVVYPAGPFPADDTEYPWQGFIQLAAYPQVRFGFAPMLTID